MNILFFLTPKNEVAYIYDDESLRQVLEKMEYHRYSAIPVINRKGQYVGTITEGDLLWSIKDEHLLNIKESEEIPLSQLKRNRDNEPVFARADMEDLIDKASNQNFVPVIDDNHIFIGIITRKDIIQYLYEHRRSEPVDLRKIKTRTILNTASY